MPAARGILWPLGIAWLVVILVGFVLLLADRPAYNNLGDWLQRNQSVLGIGLGMLGFVMIGLMVLSLYKMYVPRKPRTIPM